MGIDVAVSTVILALRPVETTAPEHASPDGEPGLPGGPSRRGGRPSTGSGSALALPLVHRTREPYRDRWALPGGWVREDEPLAAAAQRTLAETTGLRPSHLEQLYTFGRPERSPTGRVVSVVYTALVREQEAAAARAQQGEENIVWAPADGLAGLAFDHDEVVRYALWRLRTKVAYGPIAQALIGERFTLRQLRTVHEQVLGASLDPANFRRQVEASGTVVATDERLVGVRHRPPRLYRAADPDVDVPAGLRALPGAGSPYERAGPES